MSTKSELYTSHSAFYKDLVSDAFKAMSMRKISEEKKKAGIILPVIELISA